MDLLGIFKNLLGGGTMSPWMLLIMAAVMVFLTKNEDETFIEAIKRVLGSLLGNKKKPAPKNDSHSYEFRDVHDCCCCAIELAKHLDKTGQPEVAKLIRDALPKLAEGKVKHE